ALGPGDSARRRLSRREKPTVGHLGEPAEPACARARRRRKQAPAPPPGAGRRSARGRPPRSVNRAPAAGVSARVVTPLAERLIFAMGGGGFTMEPSNPLLDDYVLSLARAQQPRILFLPTASGDTSAQITAFQERFCDRLCIPEHLSLFRLRDVRRPLEEIVLAQDIIYVGGGSMRNLLALWKAHELEALLVKAWSTGTVLVGLSAGAMCWFQAGITRSSGPAEVIDGLSVLRGSLTVHADGEPE